MTRATDSAAKRVDAALAYLGKDPEYARLNPIALELAAEVLRQRDEIRRLLAATPTAWTPTAWMFRSGPYTPLARSFCDFAFTEEDARQIETSTGIKPVCLYSAPEARAEAGQTTEGDVDHSKEKVLR